MPSRLAFAALNAVHRTLQRVSRGRLGWRVARMAVVELTTTGRRSGRPHTVLLTVPLRVEGNPVLVASRGGDDRPPDWLLNLQADPVVRVREGRVPRRDGAGVGNGAGGRRVRARVATAAERAAWWPLITATYAGYRAYQERTAREIALVVLEPEGPGRVGGD
ncbi:nitroreductase/quinone reductase family protein [Georgenia ruanii]|uniref:Nitroreductase family deazaflavin-dependent oxidoreductase n=1 Tax=Georgenia ruanii TaxID=348442 RepID=A0A7J9UVJ7_9MICO|nr:nitroreductase/quinone reductase family protein [Georgenia ruanii]MPV88628.1 nitroreductase family deazaflavin-dependent oxidoreductase [Georgenia ruanii]